MIPWQLSGTPFAWPLAQTLEEALEHVTLARAVFVRVQEAQDAERLFSGSRAYQAAAMNLRMRVERAKALGASDDAVLSAAARAYHSDRCQVCGRIFRSRCEDPRFRGLCGECLIAP
ncbi:MAG: hypothetical protein C4289_03245 [Chloroflexota bacterium]